MEVTVYPQKQITVHFFLVNYNIYAFYDWIHLWTAMCFLRIKNAGLKGDFN